MVMPQLLAVFMMPQLVVGTTLHSDSTMMRREIGTDVSSKDELTIDSNANLEESDAENSESLCNYVFQYTPIDPSHQSGKQFHSPWPITCPTGAQRIGSQTFCRDLANATDKVGDPFLKPIGQQEMFPEGCFYMPPDPANPTTSDKYYFNPIGASIYETNYTDGPGGRAVCQSIKFFLGESASPDCGNASMQALYEHTTDADECLYAANCLSENVPANYRELTEAEKSSHALGCNKIPPNAANQYDSNSFRYNTGTPAADKAAAKTLEGQAVCALKARLPYVANTSSIGIAGEATSGAGSSTGGGTLVEVEDLRKREVEGEKGDNPCRFFGCNSKRCAWFSGGIVNRVVARKKCKNAVVLGSKEDAPAAANLVKIDDRMPLKHCMNIVKAQAGATCSHYFQLHMESLTCSCIPPESECENDDDEKVCQYEVQA